MFDGLRVANPTKERHNDRHLTVVMQRTEQRLVLYGRGVAAIELTHPAQFLKPQPTAWPSPCTPHGHGAVCVREDASFRL